MEDFENGNQIANDEESEFVCDANEAVQIKIVSAPEDIVDERNGFNPEYTHQFFGDNEKIFGYKGLNVKIYFSASKLIPLLEVTWDQMVDANSTALADNVNEKLGSILGPDFFNTNKEEFTRSLDNERGFAPIGEQVHAFSARRTESSFIVTKGTANTAGLKEFHKRAQAFSLFYIDAACLIDLDDPQWSFFYVWEKQWNGQDNDYVFVGYCTTYNFYVYPDNRRVRISQFLILPPYQGNGIGSNLLQVVYEDSRAQPKVVDITVEDPNEPFLLLRDTVDLGEYLAKIGPLSPLSSGVPTPELVHRAQEVLKLPKVQIQRVHQLLGLKGLDRQDQEQCRAYRLWVKKSLAIAHQDELDAMRENPTEIHKFLQEKYQELEDSYSKVIHHTLLA